MELNALTRWESIGKDLYRGGDVGREIARLKARSTHVEAQRTDTQARRSAYDETMLGGGSEGATPNLRGSRNQLAELEQEERAFLEQWRSLRDKGKRLRIEEERLEQETVPGRSEPDDQPLPPSFNDVFPDGHKAWVYFTYRFLRRFAKGFAFGYFVYSQPQQICEALMRTTEFPSCVLTLGRLF